MGRTLDNVMLNTGLKNAAKGIQIAVSQKLAKLI